MKCRSVPVSVSYITLQPNRGIPSCCTRDVCIEKKNTRQQQITAVRDKKKQLTRHLKEGVDDGAVRALLLRPCAEYGINDERPHPPHKQGTPFMVLPLNRHIYFAAVPGFDDACWEYGILYTIGISGLG